MVLAVVDIKVEVAELWWLCRDGMVVKLNFYRHQEEEMMLLVIGSKW